MARDDRPKNFPVTRKPPSDPNPSSSPSAIPALRAAALQRLREARHLVVLTGAGISAESGIPTFRDALTGLWARFDPEQLATREGFLADPRLVWGWYVGRYAGMADAQPNAGHRALAALAGRRGLFTLVTQNVDDLHERAGSRDVVRLHGSLAAARCLECSHTHPMPAVTPPHPGGSRLEPPRCLACGGLVRPGVVWFGENLPADALARAQAAAADADAMLVVGTSGLVHPAAGLPARARAAGALVVQVNPQPTELDAVCHHHLRGTAAQVLPGLVRALGA